MNDQNIWTEEVLAGQWPDAMAEVTARRRLAFVIDGFDEMGAACRNGFLSCLHALEERSESAQPKFKLLLLSREDPELELQLGQLGFENYTITSGNTIGDIQSTVTTGLNTIWKALGVRKNPDEACRKEICETIAQRSNGMHLWAALVVEYLSRVHAGNESELLDLVKELPQDIGGLYESILHDVFSRKRFVPFIRQVLLWAMFQRWRLKTAEFNIAQALGLAIDKHRGRILTHEDLEEFLEENIKIKVDLYCGHLVKFQGGRLEWVHGSLMSYLMREGGRFILPGFGLEKHPSHAAIAHACIVYLNMTYFDDSGVPLQPGRMDLWESKVRKRVREHRFVRYAALNWYEHLGDAGGAWPAHSVHSLLWREQLLNVEDEHAKSWAEVWWFFMRGPSEDYPDECPAGLIATHGKTALHQDQPSMLLGAGVEIPQEEALGPEVWTPVSEPMTPLSEIISPPLPAETPFSEVESPILNIGGSLDSEVSLLTVKERESMPSTSSPTEPPRIRESLIAAKQPNGDINTQQPQERLEVEGARSRTPEEIPNSIFNMKRMSSKGDVPGDTPAYGSQPEKKRLIEKLPERETPQETQAERRVEQENLPPQRDTQRAVLQSPMKPFPQTPREEKPEVALQPRKQLSHAEVGPENPVPRPEPSTIHAAATAERPPLKRNPPRSGPPYIASSQRPSPEKVISREIQIEEKIRIIPEPAPPPPEQGRGSMLYEEVIIETGIEKRVKTKTAGWRARMKDAAKALGKAGKVLGVYTPFVVLPPYLGYI